MNDNIRTGESATRAWWFFSVVVLGLLVSYLVAVAFWMAVDYYDAFEVLLYAKSIAHSGQYGYPLLRPLLMPVLLAPWFLLERVLPAGDFARTACHVTSVLMFAMLLAAFYRLLRLDVAPHWAALGSLCLGLNPLLVHSAPSVMQDIPATLCTTLAFYWYLTGAASRLVRRWFMAGLFLAMAASARFNLIPLPLLVIVGHELFSGRIRSQADGRWWAQVCALLAGTSALYCLLPLIVYPLTDVCRWWQVPARFFGNLLAVERVFETYPRQPAIANLRFLVESLSWPLALASVIGVVAAWKRRSSIARFHLLWFAVFFLVHTYIVAWKEARYLYPLFPPVYYFVVLGLEATTRVIRQRISAMALRPSVAVACVMLALLQPIYLAARECYRFTDPVYRTNFEREVSLYAKERAGGHPVYWLGTYYPIHPSEYVFDPADPYTYMYHFARHVVRFYTGNPVGGGKVFWLLTVADGGEAAFPGPDVIGSMEDGTVLIVNPLPGGYDTRTLPRTIQPLLVLRLRIVRFATVVQENGKRVFSSSELPSASLSLSATNNGCVFTGEEVPSNWYYVFAEIGGSQPRFVCLGRSDGRRMAGMVPPLVLPAGDDVKGLLLYFYDDIKTFAVDRNR